MTIKTVYLDQIDGVLRRDFEIDSDRDGNPRPNNKTGETVWNAELVVPGLIPSPFATDRDTADGVKLRVVGNKPDVHAGHIVRLSGTVMATAWYNARQRGNAARTGLTITAQRVHPAPAGARPAIRGGLPALFPEDVPAMFLGQADDGTASIMLAAASTYLVDGVVDIRCPEGHRLPDDLIGATVRPVGFRAFYTIPDQQDVSQRSKAELVLVCSTLERVGAQNGKVRKPDPVPAGPAPSEG